jgi:hypothetical protein
LAAAATVTLVGAILNLRLRPLDGVEGSLLFEASRIRAGLPLYTNPVVGAADYGVVPARYYVLYPPLWAAVLAFWPSTWAGFAGRVISAFAWWGSLGWLAASAKGPCRAPAWLAALFVGGVYAVAEFGGSARPDAVAVALACLALDRSVRRGEVDGLAGALFALAAWTKPNVIGMAAGAVVSCLWIAPRASFRALAGASVVSLLVGVPLHRISAGTWLEHLVAATGQPLHFRLFVHHIGARAQFFFGLLGLAALFALRGSRQQPGHRGAVACGALLGSMAWSFVTFAKIGSAANYWMEPCAAAVIVFARVPRPPLSRLSVSLLVVVVPFQAIWMAVGSGRATIESIERNREHARLLERARALCGASPEILVVADEPGIEMSLDGRLVADAFPLTHQALLGRFPLEVWIADLARPEVGCVVTAHDRIERSPSEIDVDYDYFAPAVRGALSARFARVAESAGWEVYAPLASIKAGASSSSTFFRRTRPRKSVTRPLLQGHVDPAVLLPTRFVAAGRVERAPRGDGHVIVRHAEAGEILPDARRAVLAEVHVVLLLASRIGSPGKLDASTLERSGRQALGHLVEDLLLGRGEVRGIEVELGRAVGDGDVARVRDVLRDVHRGILEGGRRSGDRRGGRWRGSGGDLRWWLAPTSTHRERGDRECCGSEHGVTLHDEPPGQCAVVDLLEIVAGRQTVSRRRGSRRDRSWSLPRRFAIGERSA